MKRTTFIVSCLRSPSRLPLAALMPLLLTACASGDWMVTTWGEEYIEEGIPAAEFVDGCSMVYSDFEVEFTSVALLLSDETPAGEVPPARISMTETGPHELGIVPVSAEIYERVYYEIGPSGSDAVRAAGEITCGGETVNFDWSFSSDSRYRCLPLEVSIPKNGDAVTELTIHGDHLFYDSLDEDGGDLRGQAIVDADADGDGTVTMAELEAVSVSDLGYPISIYTDITHLADFISQLVRGVGHVDGEGHCYVDG